MAAAKIFGKANMKTLLAFYLSKGPDNCGRMIDDILRWDDEQLEQVHDYIQWLFPLREKSQFNATAPVIDDDLEREFRANAVLQSKLRESFCFLLRFYGFDYKGLDGRVVIVPSAAFDTKALNWLTPGNHNFLRITRILKCLCVCGLANDAKAFRLALEVLYKKRGEVIGETTLCFWREAVPLI